MARRSLGAGKRGQVRICDRTSQKEQEFQVSRCVFVSHGCWKCSSESGRLAVVIPSNVGAVCHSLKHLRNWLGESGADAFTIMKLGHSSVTVSQRDVHPLPESLERSLAL